MKLLLDENFNNTILRGLKRRKPDVDVVRVQDIPDLLGQADPIVLDWAAKENRILLTHDVQTMTKHAYERIEAELPLPGIFEVSRQAAIGVIIEDLLLVIEASEPEEWANQVHYIPFK